jgi:acetyltransferase
LSQIDYDREMTIVGWDGERMAGLARSAADPDFESAECAVIIRSDLREKGLATRLLGTLVEAIAAQGIKQAVLIFPAGRPRLLNISAELGFQTAPATVGSSTVRATKNLRTRG